MKQKDYVIEAMTQQRGLATLAEPYRKVDVLTWKTKIPYATICRILQNKKEYFFRIEAGFMGACRPKRNHPKIRHKL